MYFMSLFLDFFLSFFCLIRHIRPQWREIARWFAIEFWRETLHSRNCRARPDVGDTRCQILMQPHRSQPQDESVAEVLVWLASCPPSLPSRPPSPSPSPYPAFLPSPSNPPLISPSLPLSLLPSFSLPLLPPLSHIVISRSLYNFSFARLAFLFILFSSAA